MAQVIKCKHEGFRTHVKECHRKRQTACHPSTGEVEAGGVPRIGSESLVYLTRSRPARDLS